MSHCNNLFLFHCVQNKFNRKSTAIKNYYIKSLILPFNEKKKNQYPVPQESIFQYSVSIICPNPRFVVVSKGRSHNTASIMLMGEIYWHTQRQEIARGRSSQPALCPACIMVDLHIEYASMNLTVTSGKADTMNQNKFCKESFITTFIPMGG